MSARGSEGGGGRSLRRLLIVGFAGTCLVGVGAAFRSVAAPVAAASSKAAAVKRPSAADRATGNLVLNFSVTLAPQGLACPAGTPPSVNCFLDLAHAPAPGLGNATENVTVRLDFSDARCTHVAFPTVNLSIAGKGDLLGTIVNPYPCDPPGFPQTFPFTITAGTGIYTGASGSGTFIVRNTGTGKRKDTWEGTLTVPGVDFDTTPPTITGATSRTIRIRSSLRRVRVSYHVGAQDAVDGTVAVGCIPRSGSMFKIGRTVVSCSATDSSANRADKTFAVLIRHP